MPTPLYDALRGYAAKAPLRFHMPGHKGAFLPCPELAPLARLDVTEIPSTGNLYEDLSPIREAQALWARQGEDTLTGLFLRTMAQRIQEAPADQRPLLERAVRFGLAALEGREEPQ